MPKKRKQVKRACLNCRIAHTCCDDYRPCRQCVRLGIAHACVDADYHHKKRKKRNSTNELILVKKPKEETHQNIGILDQLHLNNTESSITQSSSSSSITMLSPWFCNPSSTKAFDRQKLIQEANGTQLPFGETLKLKLEDTIEELNDCNSNGSLKDIEDETNPHRQTELLIEVMNLQKQIKDQKKQVKQEKFVNL